MSAPRLLRAVRLDASDDRVFPRTAAAGEWLVVASGLLADRFAGSSDAKERLAFTQGFLGIETLGFATFAQPAPLGEPLGTLADRLAGRLLAEAGAPDRTAALAAAETLLAESAELARGLPEGSLLAVERSLDPRSGGLRERLRRIEPARPDLHARIWAIEPDGPGEDDG